jgi:FKBP-type peptidyl-prolyl cis-trans isomerase
MKTFIENRYVMKNRILPIIVASLAILLTVVSCNKTNEFERIEQQEIEAYLKRNSNLNFELKPSGLYYLEQVAGTGRVPVKYDTAYVKYTGKFLDGQVFDTNVGSAKTLEVVIGSLGIISGFNEGLTYMAAGGKSLLLIPSSLGYGTYGNYYGGISGYTPLLFEVELVQVKPGKGQ